MLNFDCSFLFSSSQYRRLRNLITAILNKRLLILGNIIAPRHAFQLIKHQIQFRHIGQHFIGHLIQEDICKEILLRGIVNSSNERH